VYDSEDLLKLVLQDISDGTENNLTIETFSKFLEWFGPLNRDITERIYHIVSESWFHGQLSHIQAEKLIQKNSNSKAGTFLVRFSSKNRGYFTITVVGKKRALYHYRIFYNRQSQEYLMGKRAFPTLDEILQAYGRELSLKNPCPGSKYEKYVQNGSPSGDFTTMHRHVSFNAS